MCLTVDRYLYQPEHAPCALNSRSTLASVLLFFLDTRFGCLTELLTHQKFLLYSLYRRLICLTSFLIPESLTGGQETSGYWIQPRRRGLPVIIVARTQYQKPQQTPLSR